jgi:hypothetical protein
MPSFDRKTGFGVAVLAAAIFALSASAASAREAWVWACHGPNGGPVATDMSPGGALDAEAVANCAGDDATGATLRLTGANPVATSHADLSIKLPSGVTASKVVIVQTAHGSATGARYTVSLDGAPGFLVDQDLGTPVATLPSDFTKSGSGTLNFKLTCNQASPCAQGAEPVSVDVVKVGVLVDDSHAPYGSVNRNSPVNASSQLIASAIEEGVGFSRAEVLIASTPSDDAVVRSRSVAIGSCNELSPNDPTVDLPLDTNRCQTGSQAAKFTTEKGPPPVDTSLDTSALPEGIYYRRVIVYDAAGNAQDLLKNGDQVYEPFEVWHPVFGSPTATLSIGSSSSVTPDALANVKPTQGGVSPNQAGSCRSPRLSVSLNQKPLRVSKHIPVLQYGKRYSFTGRLSCVVNRKRISAPKRTRLELLNKVGNRTVTKTGPKVADKGRFKISLKYPVGSRTLIFRFRNADGQRSQVSIKVKIEKKNSKR